MSTDPRAAALHEAYWALRQQASAYRGELAVRGAYQAAQAGDPAARLAYKVHDARASGIEAAADTVAAMLDGACTCPDIDVTVPVVGPGPRQTIKGWDQRCPQHATTHVRQEGGADAR